MSVSAKVCLSHDVSEPQENPAMITTESIQRHCPSLEGRSYLNTAAECIPPTCVGEALAEYWQDKQLGMDGREKHFAREKEAKSRAAKLLGLTAEEVAFCSCSSEAYNLLASALRLGPDEEVVVTDIDFPAGFTPWLRASPRPCLKVWKFRDGILDLSDLADLIGPQTRLVQVSLVSFYNGWMLPWEAFVAAVRAQAPGAVISVDVTQALGRCVFDIAGADIVISSTHKWLLGIHGGCVVGVPASGAERMTTKAGGWYHIRNAFDTDRFEQADHQVGAASYAVGMPSFAPIYALNAAMEFLLSIGVEKIARYADPLVQKAYEGLVERGISPLAALTASGIVAFKHSDAEHIYQTLRSKHVHVMHQAGRLRLALHGYNTDADVSRFFEVLDSILTDS
jgi:cysteine desulfurase / selenocysteine lyase